MAEPLVRAALTYFHETQSDEDGDRLARLENGDRWHSLSDHDGLRADILAHHHGRAFIEDHGDDFPEVAVEFLERPALAVGARKAGDIPNIEIRIRASLHDGGISMHRHENPTLFLQVILGADGR